MEEKKGQKGTTGSEFSWKSEILAPLFHELSSRRSKSMVVGKKRGVRRVAHVVQVGAVFSVN